MGEPVFGELSIVPFVKRGRYYYGPSGKRFTMKQVKRYYATKGKWK